MKNGAIFIFFIFILSCMKPIHNPKLPDGYTYIISNSKSVSDFLQSEGIPFDSLWIPDISYKSIIDSVLLKYLDNAIVNFNDSTLFSNDSTTYHIIKYYYTNYTSYLSGFYFKDNKCIIGNLHLSDRPEKDTIKRSTFPIVFDGGIGVILFVYSFDLNRVLLFRWNGNG